MRILVLTLALWSYRYCFAGPVIKLVGGDAEGIAYGDVGAWLGIPFAQPPVGDLRWRPPQAPSNWTGKLDATDFRHNCMQKSDSSMGWPQPVSTMSEDCLYLNVYAPLTKPSEPKAVLLWIYGGGFQGGGGNETRLNGTWDVALTNGNLIVVTFNYRLNVFGFAASDLLRDRDPLNGTGNYGILDQRMAMKWVKANIGSFGGDPARVFIVGQSAGANSVSDHLVRPASWGLFSAAGMESGAFYNSPESTVREVQGGFKSLLSEFSCKNVDCLLHVPAELLEKSHHNEWNPVIDGVDLVDSGVALASSGRLADVPVLVGNVMEDIDGLGGSMKCDATACSENDFREWASSFLGLSAADVDHLSSLYADEVARPGGSNSKWWWARKHAGADVWATCPARRMARWTTAIGQKAFKYYWTYAPMGFNGRYPDMAHHALEQPFVFHVLSETPDQEREDHGAYHIQPEERKFSEAVVRYWASFADGHVPQGDVAWPAFTEQSQWTLVLGDPSGSVNSMSIEAVQGLRSAKCDFWDHHTQKPAPVLLV